MELKVWVEGIQRIVCGVTESTTCQDVVFALAHATGKSGRFTLIERWRSNERQLAPQENPMKVFLKWGEYSNDVQFILQRNDCNQQQKTQQQNNKPKANGVVQHETLNNKPLQFSSNYNTVSENVGVVKGVQQPVKTIINLEVKEQITPQNSPKKSSYNSGSSDISDRTVDSPPSHLPTIQHHYHHRHQQQQQRLVAPPYKNPPAPPPYRDPPPPNSVLNSSDKFRKKSPQEYNQIDKEWNEKKNKIEDNSGGLYNAQYKELVALINYQKDKLNSQQADLTKYDAEIVFLESKEREKQYQFDFLVEEVLKISNISKVNQEQLQALNYVEEECEIVKQQEKTLKSELTLLRSKLANCETELLQCKNKMRLLMEELHLEQRINVKKSESRKQIEKGLFLELERIQKDIDLAKQSSDLHHLTAETLKKEVTQLEELIVDKKKRVEQLVNEMKEANLESLSIVPPEDIRQILEGPNKGSIRKMIGSPRQLENAVPTSKNPHGVWV